jgi:YegS/Rv2252/BmrU family lipid kinase
LKRIIFIVNGAKKQSKKLTGIFDVFSKSTFFTNVEVVFTKYSGHAKALARENTLKFDYMIAVGGDGTLNEVINGVDLSSNIILGLLPYGTGNDFSRGQNLKLDALFLLNLIQNNSVKTIDIGWIKSLINDTLINRRFINIADIGLGGYVSQKILKNNSKFISGKIKYAQAILKGIIQYSKPILKVEGDFKYQGKVLTLAICNSNYFGYGLCIAPKADIQDELLNISCIGNVSLWDYFKNISNIKSGKIINHTDVNYTTIKSINVFHVDEPCPIECDGEFIGFTPVTIQILPKQLKFLLP